jgi:hypothetical protein
LYYFTSTARRFLWELAYFVNNPVQFDPESSDADAVPRKFAGLSLRGWLWVLGAVVLLLVIFRAYLRPEIMIDFVMRYCA